MLEDLNKFREQAIDSFNRNYDPEDRCLPMEFKRLCTKFNINDTIEYKEYSMIIHGASSLNIFMSLTNGFTSRHFSLITTYCWSSIKRRSNPF